ncbi:MAG: glycosyltransferase [Bacteroidetes bacterium]|nr:MAG: glycosyltransferase [Bacteroidota bacterium]TNE98099.1 MAG: glycosyltransferase [Bacteroidota bacterium]
MIIWLLYYLYFFFQVILLFYALTEFGLMLRLVFSKEENKPRDPEEWPEVLVQLPVYNEQYVIGRLIDATCELDYPKEKLKIQVLDDSNDETIAVVSALVKHYQSTGIHIEHIQRPNRTGFKAGALAYGLELCGAPYVAIFDADFIPNKDFLKLTIPHFYSDQKIGVVQSRWAHINEDHSLLTRIQAIFLNTHFTVEQVGRNKAGAYINFNGTAGVWRRTCIDDGGGWQADTLTEDLDLSFRAQMKGWKFKYMMDIQAPSELPVSLPAFKVQQFRWSKGAAECSRKNLKALFKTKNLSLGSKIIGAFHLLNSSAYILIVSFILLSLPMAYFFSHFGKQADPFGLLNYTYLTTILLFFVFLIGNLKVSRNKLKTLVTFPVLFPMFLMTSMGISLYLMIGVIEGYVGKRSDFVRTPKFNITRKVKDWKTKKYAGVKLTPVFVLELILWAYCVVAIIYTMQTGIIPLLVYEVMFFLGLTANIIANVIHRKI